MSGLLRRARDVMQRTEHGIAYRASVPHGDGVRIVVAGVAPGCRGGESPLQGEVGQVTTEYP